MTLHPLLISIAKNLNSIVSNNSKILPRITSSFFLAPCDHDEISTVVMSLKNTSSVGPDGISTKILKSCRDVLAPLLCYLANSSFSQGLFPEALKSHIIKPLFKKGE